MWRSLYRSADKSLAWPGRKQARKHVREARDFNNIETRAVIKSPTLQGKAPKEIHAILTETLAGFLPGRAKDLSALLYCEYRLYQRDRNTGSCCQIVMKFEFYQQTFEKYSNMQFNKNPSSGSRAVSCGQTDRHDEASSHFSAILRKRLKRHLYV